MNFMKKILCVMLGFALIAGLTSLQIAEAKSEYPSKPIKAIVCYSPGGDADLTTRAWAGFAEKVLGQPIVVINKTGGGGVAGTTFAAKSKPDGYTIFTAQAGQNLIAPQIAKTAYDWDSFDYICRVTIGNCGLVVHNDAKWKTLKEFVEDAKANPGELRYASPGAVTWLTLAVQHWEMQAGIKMKHVAHQGSAPAMTSILGRHADISFVFPQNYAPQVKSGKMRLLALGAPSDEYPGVPSFEQLGYSGSYFGWAGICAPKGVPEYVVNKISEITKNKIMSDPKFLQALKNIHATPAYLGPEDFQKVLKAQYNELSKVVDALGVRVK